MQINVYQKFILLSIIATAFLVAGLNILTYHLLTKWLLEQEGTITAQAIRTVTIVDLPPEEFARAVREQDTKKFAYIWQHLSSIPEVFRAKIYDMSGKIVWSDEPRLINKVYADDLELHEALEGKVEIQLGALKAEHEFERSMVPEGQLLEIYVPLSRRLGGPVYCVVEIYKHPQTFLLNRSSLIHTIWGAGTIAGLLLFLALAGLFRGAWLEQVRLQEVERQYAEVEVEMKVAAAIQTRLLPKAMPDLPGFDLAAYHQPSGEIGGDYYDAFLAGDGALVLSVADGEGKGIPGALVMVETRELLRAQMRSAGTAADAVRAVNQSLSGEPGPGRIITMFLAKLEPASRTLTYCNAGHCMALLVRDGAVTGLNDGGGVPMGVLTDAQYTQGAAQLAGGDVLLLYTDGVTEARNPAGELLGQARLRAVLCQAAASHSASEVVERVRTAVAEFSAGHPLTDDTTIVCLTVGPSVA